MPSRQMNGQHRPVAHSRHSTFFNPEGLQQHEAFFNGKQTSSLRPVQRKAQEAPPSKPNNTGLPGHLKSGVENLSGLAMDDVKVHYNSDKPVQLQAAAYTQGTEIHVAPGQEKHLPHEAWHVVQQKQGRVAPTTQLKQTFVNDNEVLEKEADEKGSESLSRGAAPGTDLQAHVIQRVSNTNSGVVQFGKKTKKPSPLEKLIKKDVQYTFTYNRGAIGGNVASSNTTLAATEEDNLLKLVQAKHKELEAMKDYPIGKGKGESYDFNYRGVGIKIRFDKVNRKFYPRVSFEDINDPSTLELEGLMRKYDESSIAQFIMGVRGVVPPAESQNPNKPNKTGLGVRAVLLISDFLDFETNSPLNINFLGKVTAENYSTLFSGGKFQTSFGAMPSQNYNTKEEGSQERIAVYNKVGEFIKTGRLTVSGALTNIPVLRKIAAMLRFDSGIFTVKKGNAKISALAYIEEVDGLNIVARNVNRGKQDANIFSDPEDDSDDEREKMKPLKEKQRRKLLADLYRKRDALNRKIRLLEGQGNAEDSESKISDKEVSEEMVFEKSNSTSEVSEYSGDEDDLNDEVIEDTRKRKSKEQGAVTKKYHKRNNDM